MPSKCPRTAIPQEKTRHLQATILRMRRDDPTLTWAEIGEQLGYSAVYVRKAYLKALHVIIREPAEDILKLELERLDLLQTEVIKVLKAVHPVVSSGQVVRDFVDDENGNPIIDAITGNPLTRRLEDQAPKLAAVDRALRIMERRARYLGLDKTADPQKAGMTAEEFAEKVLGTVRKMEEVTAMSLFPDDEA